MLFLLFSFSLTSLVLFPKNPFLIPRAFCISPVQAVLIFSAQLKGLKGTQCGSVEIAQQKLPEKAAPPGSCPALSLSGESAGLGAFKSSQLLKLQHTYPLPSDLAKRLILSRLGPEILQVL